MALPTGPIPRVALGEIIEENWGDSVAQSLNNLKEAYEQILWTPTGDILAPTTYTSSGDLPVWFRVNPDADVHVPDWATRAIVRVDLNGLWVDGDGDATYDVQVQIGPTTGRRIRANGRQSGALPADAGDRQFFGMSWVDYINVSSIEGDRAVRILAGRYASSRRWGVSTYSDIGVFVTYAESAINWYPSI